MIHQKIDEAFAIRHPVRAAEEAAFRDEQGKLQDRYGHRRGTPETLARVAGMQQGSLARLFEGGHLSIDQLAWGAEIRMIAERIGRDVAIGTVSLETRVDCGANRGARAIESLGRVRSEVAYSGWRAALTRPAPVLAMIVDDLAVRPVAVHFRMRDAGARDLLIDALDAWPDWCADARDRVDEEDLARMAARLA